MAGIAFPYVHFFLLICVRKNEHGQVSSSPSPSFRCGFPSDFGPALRRQLITPGCASLPAERLGGLVLARIAHFFLDLARQNFGDADRVGDAIGGSLLAQWSFRHASQLY